MDALTTELPKITIATPQNNAILQDVATGNLRVSHLLPSQQDQPTPSQRYPLTAPHPQTCRRQKPNARTQTTPFPTKSNWQEEARVHWSHVNHCQTSPQPLSNQLSSFSLHHGPQSCWDRSPQELPGPSTANFSTAGSSQHFTGQLIYRTWIIPSRFRSTTLVLEVTTGAWNMLVFWKWINLSPKIYSTCYSSTTKKRQRRVTWMGWQGLIHQTKSKRLLTMSLKARESPFERGVLFNLESSDLMRIQREQYSLPWSSEERCKTLDGVTQTELFG